MADHNHPGEPDLTWDHELSQWVPAYRQTRWDQTADHDTETCCSAHGKVSLRAPGVQAGPRARGDVHVTHPSDVPPDLMNDSDPNEARTGVPDKDWLVARADRLNAEATASTSLDRPGTGAGYTAVEPHCRCTDPACTKVTHYYGDPVPPAGPGLDPLERRITAAILSAYRVPLDVLPAMVERVADAVRPDAPAEREQPTWLLDLVHAAETAAEEISCNGDHEGNDDCDGCAWADLIETVPARLRNAADEHASKGGAW